MAARKNKAGARPKAVSRAKPSAGAGEHVGELKVAAAARAPSAPEVRLVETEPVHAPAEVLQEEDLTLGEAQADEQAARDESEDEAPSAFIGTPAPDAQLAEVMAHLVFHKSLIREADKGANVERYLELARGIREGVHLAIDDPNDKCMALVFELVISEKMNPWDIDLRQFSKLYMARVKGVDDIDFITAGKLMLMAWSVLKAQTEEVLGAIARIEAQRKAEQDASQGVDPNAMEFLENQPWLSADETTYNFTKAVIEADPLHLDEAVHPPGERPVTLYDLISAFEEAKEESATRAVLEEERAKARAELERARKAKVSGMMHNENLEEEIAQTWMKILERVHHEESPAAKIPMGALHDGTKGDFLSVFVSTLFLAFNQRVTIEQTPFPTGEVLLQLTPEAQKGNLPAMPAPPVFGPSAAPAAAKKARKGTGQPAAPAA
jgi:segregation and condensation protein A